METSGLTLNTVYEVCDGIWQVGGWYFNSHFIQGDMAGLYWSDHLWNIFSCLHQLQNTRPTWCYCYLYTFSSWSLREIRVVSGIKLEKFLCAPVAEAEQVKILLLDLIYQMGMFLPWAQRSCRYWQVKVCCRFFCFSSTNYWNYWTGRNLFLTGSSWADTETEVQQKCIFFSRPSSTMHGENCSYYAQCFDLWNFNVESLHWHLTREILMLFSLVTVGSWGER